MEIGEIEKSKKEDEETGDLEELVEEKSESKEEGEDSEKVISDLNLDNINNLEFSQFNSSLNFTETGSPVLENIESRIDRPMFVSMGGQASSAGGGNSNSDGESSGINYIPSSEGGNEVKYVESGGEVQSKIKRIDMQKIGRDVGNFNMQRQEDFFITSQPNFQSRTVENVGMQPGRIDPLNVGRESRFEAEEKKYEKYEPDLPK